MIFATNQVRHVLVQNSDSDGPVFVLQEDAGGNTFKIIQETADGTFISASDSIEKDKIISISLEAVTPPFKAYIVDVTNWNSEGGPEVAYLKVNIYEGPGSVNYVTHYIPYTGETTNVTKLGLVWEEDTETNTEDSTTTTTGTLSQKALASTAAGKSGIIHFSVSFVDGKLKPVDIEVEESKVPILPGYMVKKLEEFCNSFKGDMNFGVGFPYCSDPVPTYADPNEDYDMLNIHYYYEGSNEAVQKSEKDLTLCTISSNGNVVDNLVTNLKKLSHIKVIPAVKDPSQAT